MTHNIQLNSNLHSLYITGRKLGKGSQGSVYLATHKQTHEKLVVKIVSKQETNSIKSAQDIRHEYRVLQKLNHEHIIRPSFLYEDEKEVRLYQEYAPRGDLFSLLKRKREEQSKSVLTEKEARPIIADIISALSHSHSRRIYHGDIKLENVFLGENNTVKLGDWGLSSFHIEHSDNPVSPRAGTSTNSTIPYRFGDVSPREKTPTSQSNFTNSPAGGSFQYSAPEIFTDCSMSAASDVWSLGVLMYVLLCGKFPFDYSRPFQNRYKRMYPVPLNISQNARNLLLRMLSQDIKLRPSVVEIAESRWLNTLDDENEGKETSLNLEQIPLGLNSCSTDPSPRKKSILRGLQPILEEPEC